jgi:uncharacterized phage-associated protein
MNSALNVAKYITDLLEVDQLKLQKLLFYSQAVCLVKFNKPAFDDPIEAWDYGPVAPNVYHYVKTTDAPIKIPGITFTPMDNQILSGIDIALEYYGPKSGISLISETHSEDPMEKCLPER